MMRFVIAAALLPLGACGSDDPSTSGTAAGPSQAGALTRADVEAYVTRQAKSLATGIAGNPLSVDVTFQSVEIAPGRAPILQETQIDGLKGDVAYPVRVRYTEKRHFNGEDQTRETYYSYTFYRDEFGGWSALGNGPAQ